MGARTRNQWLTFLALVARAQAMASRPRQRNTEKQRHCEAAVPVSQENRCLSHESKEWKVTSLFLDLPQSL